MAFRKRNADPGDIDVRMAPSKTARGLDDRMTETRGPDAARPSARRATMRDVAAAAGVSLKTVSRVLNAEPAVNHRTTARVESAVERLHYRRDALARSLRKGIRQLSVGLVIEDLTNPFYGTVAQAVEDVADRNGHSVILISSREDPAREQRLITNLLQREVEGLLIVPASQDHRYLEAEVRRGTPMVFLDRSPRGIDADTVLLENMAGARLAVQHLVAVGHRRIAFVGDPLSHDTSSERFDGYRRALAEAGIPLAETLVKASTPSVDDADQATRELLSLEKPPTAIFAQNNRACIGVLRALRGAGATLAVVGFDDFELATLLPVPVTVVASEPAEMGRIGAEMLFERLDGLGGPPRRVLIPGRLVVRGTGEIPPESVVQPENGHR